MSSDPATPAFAPLRATLAAALRGESVPWPEGQQGAAWAAAMPEAILYHGVAGRPDELDIDRQTADADLRHFLSDLKANDILVEA